MEDKRIKNSYEEVRHLQASIGGLIQYFDQELYYVLYKIYPYIPNINTPKFIVDKEWLPPLLLTLGGYMDSLNVIQFNLISLEQNNSEYAFNSQSFKNKVSEYLKERVFILMINMMIKEIKRRIRQNIGEIMKELKQVLSERKKVVELTS